MIESPASDPAPPRIAGAMGAAAVGATLATFVLLFTALTFDWWYGADTQAMIVVWTVGIVLAVAGIALLTGRRRLSLSGVMFIASALLVGLASVILMTRTTDFHAFVGRSVVVAALLLLLAGVLALRLSSGVAPAAAQRETAGGGRPAAAQPDAVEAEPSPPPAASPLDEGEPRSVLVLPSIVLAFNAILLTLLWGLAAVYDEGYGIAADVQLAFVAWIVGSAVAGVGVALLAGRKRPRLAGLFLLAASLLGAVAVVVFAAAADPDSEALGYVVVWAFVSSPFFVSAVRALTSARADNDTVQASS